MQVAEFESLSVVFSSNGYRTRFGREAGYSVRVPFGCDQSETGYELCLVNYHVTPVRGNVCRDVTARVLLAGVIHQAGDPSTC